MKRSKEEEKYIVHRKRGRDGVRKRVGGKKEKKE